MLYSTLFAAFAIGGQSAGWNYEERGNNVSHWASIVPECGYSRQSPIDIPMLSDSTCAEPLELEWTSESAHYAIRNGGHSLKAVPFEIDHNGGADISGLEVLHHTNDTNIRLTNKFFNTYSSKVNSEYCFDSLHFHWGRNENEGSEHTINGKAYPLEVHLVHYSCDYYMAGAALKEYASGEAKIKYDDENVLAVIGVVFEIGAPNPVLAKMLDDIIIDNIAENQAQEIPNYLEMFYSEFDVKGLLPESREMVSYLGSLTTPPCYETVRWHVMKQAMTVSEEQMESFRKLLEGTDLNESQAPNFRPPQPRNNRKIWSCQEDVDDNKIREEEEGNVLAVDNSDNSGDQFWRDIAVAFIVLFSCTMCLLFVVLCYLCKTHNFMVPRTKRASIADAGDYDQEIQTTTANDEAF